MPKKVDLNHTAMVKALRNSGFHVWDTHECGDGAPDLVVTQRATGRVLLVEVKGPKGKLTSAEVYWHTAYPDNGALIVAREADDVLKWFGMV